MMAMPLSDRRRREALPAGRTLVRSAAEEPLRFDAGPGPGMPRPLIEEAGVSGETLLPGPDLTVPAAGPRRHAGLVVGGLEKVPVRW